MATFTFVHRLLVAGGFAVAVAAAPLVAAVATPAAPALADNCPSTELLDPASGACQPFDDVAPPTQDPINPENSQLQPGGLTDSTPGDVGELPAVDGIPCDGGNTGQCIGLQESSGGTVKVPEIHTGVTG